MKMKRGIIAAAVVGGVLSFSMFTGVARADAGMQASNEMAPMTTIAFADEAVPAPYSVALGEKVQVAQAASGARKPAA